MGKQGTTVQQLLRCEIHFNLALLRTGFDSLGKPRFGSICPRMQM